MDTNDIKKHFPFLYDILVARANESIKLKRAFKGFRYNCAIDFIRGWVFSIDKLLLYRHTPEGYAFWNDLDVKSYFEVKDNIEYQKYKEPSILIHDLWI